MAITRPSYYEQSSQNDDVKPTLIRALQSFNEESPLDLNAIDLGCGVGKDTAYLVRNGWKVIAIDAQKIAEEYLKKKVPSEYMEKVTFVNSTFEKYPFSEKVALINASYSLPFCSPEQFDSVMKRITDAIFPGGRFAGQFFGPNDSWAERPSMTFLIKDKVLNYFSKSYTVELFEEIERDAESSIGPKHWHVFNIVAKKL